MKGSVYWTFIGWSLLSCLIGRALNVYPLVSIFNNHLHRKNEHEALEANGGSRHSNLSTDSNRLQQRESVEMTSMGSDHRPSTTETPSAANNLSTSQERHFAGMVKQDLQIRPNTAHMLWFSGLRGAVAYACVRSFPDTFHHDDEFTVTTMVIVLVTVFGLGSTTEAALNWLDIEMNVDEGQYMEAWHRERSEDGLILQVETVLQHYALRTEPPMAVNTDEDHGAITAGESAIASGFHHHHPEGDDTTEHGVSIQMGPRQDTRKRDSVFDYGSK